MAPYHAASAELPIAQVLNDLASGVPKVKIEAAIFLSQNRQYPKQVIPLLIKALEDERPEEETPLGIPAPPWLVADEAQRALVSYGAVAVPMVTELLGHSMANVRRRAARILEQNGPAAASSAPRLAKVVSDERESSVQSACLRAFGAVEDNSSRLTQVLLEALDAESPDYHALAIRICGRRNLQDEDVIRRLLTALSDRRSRWGSWSPDTIFPVPIRRDAAEALGRIGPAASKAEPSLRKMMESDDDVETKVAAAFAVFRIMVEDRRALDLLIEIAGQPDQHPGAAPVAIQFLGELGPKAKSALPVLIRSCTYRSAESLGFDTILRSEALAAVAAVGGVSSLAVLRNALKSVDPFDREAAADAISQFRREARDAVPELIQAAQDDRGVLSARSQGAVAKALGNMGPDAKAALTVLRRMATARYEPWDAWLADAAKKSLSKIEESDGPEFDR